MRLTLGNAAGVLGLIALLPACGARSGLDAPDGAPQLVCPGSFAHCDRRAPVACETDLGWSRENCGGCGRMCPEGLTCAAGACRPANVMVAVAVGWEDT
jgi:hypothetical protein